MRAAVSGNSDRASNGYSANALTEITSSTLVADVTHCQITCLKSPTPETSRFPSFPRRREPMRQLFSERPMDSRLRGNDGVWLEAGFVRFRVALRNIS